MEIKSFLIIFLLVNSFANVIFSLPPLYSEKYAQVRYQPHDNLRKAELNLEKRDREEVTEKSGKHSSDNQTSDIEVFEVTTEPESEQINIARFVHRNIVKDKLIKGKEMNLKEVEETTLKSDFVEEFSSVEIKSTNAEKENQERKNPDQSELYDLNQEGPYHIYHPNGYYRKTVFNMEDYLKQFQLSSEVKYVPIVESIYTYDPRTFLFQRLLIRT